MVLSLAHCSMYLLSADIKGSLWKCILGILGALLSLRTCKFFFPTHALDEALFVFAKSMHFPYWVAPQPSKHSTFWLHHQLVIFSSAWHYFNTTLWPRVGKVPFFKIILANGPEMSWPCAQKTSLTSPIENVVETWYPGIQITFCHSANTVHSDDVAS